jgi:hypothetical protein
MIHSSIARFASCVMFLAIAIAAPLRGLPSEGNARAKIVALENDWLNHETDGPTLQRILAGDFVHVLPQGLFITKAEHIQYAVAHPHPATWHGKFTKLEVRVYGTAAIANGIIESSDAPAAKVRRSAFTDVFVNREGHWQAVNAQESEMSSVP